MILYDLLKLARFLVILGILAAVLMGMAVIFNPPVTPMNEQHVSKHPEAMTVAQCPKGDSIWLDNDCIKIKIIKDVDGQCSLEVLEPTLKGLKLITAFYFDRGSHQDLVNILKAQGCSRVIP